MSWFCSLWLYNQEADQHKGTNGSFTWSPYNDDMAEYWHITHEYNCDKWIHKRPSFPLKLNLFFFRFVIKSKTIQGPTEPILINLRFSWDPFWKWTCQFIPSTTFIALFIMICLVPVHAMGLLVSDDGNIYYIIDKKCVHPLKDSNISPDGWPLCGYPSVPKVWILQYLVLC